MPFITGWSGATRLRPEHADPRRAQAPLLAVVVPDGRSGEAHLRLRGAERDEAVGDGGGVVAPGAAADVQAAALDVGPHGARAFRAERLDLPEHRAVAAAGHDEHVEAGESAAGDVLREDEVDLVTGAREDGGVMEGRSAGAVEGDA